MLSKRNLVMMMTMFIVVLVLFLSSAVLKEFFNDYDVNHSYQTEIIEKKEQQEIQEERGIFFIGTEDNGYFQVMKEWAGYRKKSFSVFTSLDAAYENLQTRKEQMPCLLVDGELIEENVIFAAKKLTEYVEAGGVVIFYRLPSYKTIKGSDTLQQLLGIQHVREESIQLHEIRLYSGFLLGGETCYSFEGVEETERVDLEPSWADGF